MKKCEIESLEVKSYRVVFSDFLTSKPIALELIFVDKKQRLYQIIPEKECLMDLNALHFAHICCALFAYPNLEIHSLYYTLRYQNGTTINHTISRNSNNSVESYYEQILINTQVILMNSKQDSQSNLREA